MAAGTEIFWRESSREIEEIYNRLEICKHGEIAAPVHVKERGGEGMPRHRHFGNKGGVEKGKVRPTGSGSAKAAKEKRLD